MRPALGRPNTLVTVEIHALTGHNVPEHGTQHDAHVIQVTQGLAAECRIVAA
jgi:hypothetical protein